MLACKKVSSRLCGAELRLKIFRQKDDKAANNRHFTADAEACHDVDRVRQQMPHSSWKIYRQTMKQYGIVVFNVPLDTS